MFILSELKGVFMKNTKNKLAAAVVKDDIKEIKKKLDPSEVGGTAMLGISKPVIKAHGSSDALAIRSAIRQAMYAVNSGFCDEIRANIAQMTLLREVDNAE